MKLPKKYLSQNLYLVEKMKDECQSNLENLFAQTISNLFFIMNIHQKIAHESNLTRLRIHPLLCTLTLISLYQKRKSSNVQVAHL